MWLKSYHSMIKNYKEFLSVVTVDDVEKAH